MTALFVKKDHVDALISIAIRWGPGPGEGLTWAVEDPETTPQDETTFRTLRGLGRDDQLVLDSIGVMLLVENARSLEHRYGDAPDVGSYCFTPVEASWLEDPEMCFRPIAAYCYYSSEHPGWTASEALRFCEALEQTLVLRLPRYELGPWVFRRA